MIDIQLLRLMRVRSDFNKIKSALNINALETKTRSIVHAVDQYYKKHKSHGKIDFSVFIPFMERNVYPDMSTDDKAVHLAIVKNMTKNYPDADTRYNILEGIHERNFVHRMANVSDSYTKGEDIDPIAEISSAMDRYKLGVGVGKMPEVGEDIDHLLEDMDNDSGLHWRLPVLNKSMRPLRGGDFGIIAARPDQGKTSFMCSELSFMAPQCPKDRPILWLNNEGPGYAIRPRLMQAALDCTTEDLLLKKEAGTLYDEYYEAMGGQNRVRIMDIHGYNNSQVESLIDDIEPSLIIYDMIDNVHGFGHAARTDLALEQMYQWAREKAVKYDASALATSQISAEGIDEKYPGLGMLKDSKTGKQGACDFQLMIGSMETKPELANARWLSLPKNKLRRVKSNRLLEQVTFDRDKARYKEID
jgi:replicative DNA helicase